MLSCTLMLCGCGGTESEVGAESTAKSETALADELEENASALAAGVEDPSMLDASNVEEIPVSEDGAYADAAVNVSEVGVDDSPDDKAPSGGMRLTSGGITMVIPSTWSVSQNDVGFVLTDANTYLQGNMWSKPLESSKEVDLETLVKVLPAAAVERGCTNVQIVSCQTVYSGQGTPCEAIIWFTATDGGVDYLVNAAVVKSKTYYNIVQFTLLREHAEQTLPSVRAAEETISFVGGEAI